MGRVGVVAVPTFKNNNDRFALYLEVSCTRVSRFAAYAYVKIRPSQMAQPAYQPKSEKLWHFSTNLVETWYILNGKTHHMNFFLPVMAAVAVRKKVVSIGHFSPSFCF